jgi:hypothetical protein
MLAGVIISIALLLIIARAGGARFKAIRDKIRSNPVAKWSVFGVAILITLLIVLLANRH